jgi:hypothetical protein
MKLGTCIAIAYFARKEVRTMKIANKFLAGLVLMGSLTAVNSLMAADGVIEKVPFTAGSYCHEKFPAIEGRTLDTDNPTLKSANSGDVVDFYGPCSEKPTGKDQQQEQELERQHRFENDYED